MAENDPKLLATLGVGVRVANRYVIRRVLGKGGMGQVFEVENDAIGRRFALKVLSLSFAGDDAIKRFRREAKALGRISSPRVAQVIDFDVDSALGPFLVMELLDGETLQQRLARAGRMPAAEAVKLSVELCEALAEVHASGIVHRDLKPSNIGLPKSGQLVKLLDFGLAASVDEAFTERLTQSQQFLGTLPYMAPELFHGHPPTEALDLYALGAVLYEMLAGRTPFVGSNPAQYVAQHLASEVPAIATVAAGVTVPAWLETIVRRLLAKEAKDRFATAATVAAALRNADAVGFDSTVSAPSSALSGAVAASIGAGRKRRWPWLVAIGMVVLLGGVAATVMAWRARHREAVVTVTPPPKIEMPPPKIETPPIAVPPPTVVATPPPAKTEPPKATAPQKHPAHKSAAKKPRSKSWNGEILEE